MSIRKLLWFLAVGLLLLAAVVPKIGRVAVLPLGLAATVAAYSWPVIGP